MLPARGAQIRLMRSRGRRARSRHDEIGRGIPRAQRGRFPYLKHTWASWYVQSGTSLSELMELGGWKSYEMVLRYRHVAQEKLNSVAERIGRQPVSNLTVTPPTENVAANGTFSIRSVR